MTVPTVSIQKAYDFPTYETPPGENGSLLRSEEIPGKIPHPAGFLLHRHFVSLFEVALEGYLRW
jgi:hypothetical protein